MNLTLLVIFCFAISTCYSLMCYECINAKSNEECLETGGLNFCTEENSICENQVRHNRFGDATVIEKRCKQSLACNNNVIQNPRAATPTQCFIRASSSVCRCCCTTDGCNQGLLNCYNGSQIDVPEPKNCPDYPETPANGNKQCTGNLEPGTQCSFECHQGYYLSGEKVLTCLSNGTYDHPPPKCNIKKCLPEILSFGNGSVECTNTNCLRSRCSFKCDEGFDLIGSPEIDCIDTSHPQRARWTNEVPFCNRTTCPQPGPIRNGRFSCTGNTPGSVCNWECNMGFSVYPFNFRRTLCLSNGKWNRPWPCCNRRCTASDLALDLLVLVDSSDSVGLANWNTTKAFVRQFFDQFTLSPEFSHFAFFQFNRIVPDNPTGSIHFDAFTRNKIGFLERFDTITYQNGDRTFTGTALNFTNGIFQSLPPRNAAKTLLLITDGRSNPQNDPVLPARLLRANNVSIYVIPVKPDRGVLDFTQIISIAGSSANVFNETLEGGFGALDDQLAMTFAERLCPRPCSDPRSNIPEEREPPRRLLSYINNQN